MKSVYRAVRTEPLNKAVCAQSFEGEDEIQHELQIFSLYRAVNILLLSYKQKPVNLKTGLYIATLEERCQNSEINFSVERENPLAGAMQSHQKNDTSPLSRPF
jgi:hypothetical protein